MNLKVDCSGRRCSIKNMRAKRQGQSSMPVPVSAGESAAGLVSPSPTASTIEKKAKWPPQKRQSSGSSDDTLNTVTATNRPLKLFFARRSSKDSSDPPLSPPPPRSPGVKSVKLYLCPLARRGYEEALALQQEQQQQQQQPTKNSPAASTSTLVDAVPALDPRQQKRQTSLDTLVDEPVSDSAEEDSAGAKLNLKQRMQLTDQQLMLIVVALAVSQCILLARLRAAAM